MAVRISPLLSRFRGSLVGAVVGDCFGAFFENDWDAPSPSDLKKFFDEADSFGSSQGEFEDSPKKRRLQKKRFTDDTAMARSIAVSLIEKKNFCAEDMADRFQKEFYREPKRGYGGNIITVFEALRDKKYQDVFEAAQRQFDGQGSYGNGGAMRIAPAALFGYSFETEKLESLIRDITLLTHGHPDAIRGAILQGCAVHYALHEDNSKELNRTDFIDKLIKLMSRLESEGNQVEGLPKPKRIPKRKADLSEKPYTEKLKIVKKFMNEDVDVAEVEETLGNDVSALGSVPAAVLSFLKGNQPCKDIERDNPFERTIMYAISLGGDTDTIATMACAMAGAFYGLDKIPESWQAQCEGVNDAMEFADKFHGMIS